MRPGGCPAILRRPNLNWVRQRFYTGMAQPTTHQPRNDQRPPQRRHHLPNPQDPNALRTTNNACSINWHEHCSGASAAEVRAFPTNTSCSGRAMLIARLFGSATPSWNIPCSRCSMRKLCLGVCCAFACCQQNQTAAIGCRFVAVASGAVQAHLLNLHVSGVRSPRQFFTEELKFHRSESWYMDQHWRWAMCFRMGDDNALRTCQVCAAPNMVDGRWSSEHEAG